MSTAMYAGRCSTYTLLYGLHTGIAQGHSIALDSMFIQGRRGETVCFTAASILIDHWVEMFMTTMWANNMIIIVTGWENVTQDFKKNTKHSRIQRLLLSYAKKGGTLLWCAGTGTSHM